MSPTGFTAPIYEAEEGFSLRDYLLRCAHNFGFAGMYDRPLDAPIPEQRRPDTERHTERIAQAEAAKLRLENLSAEQIEQEAEAAFIKDRTKATEAQQQRAAIRKRYEQMTKELRAWEAPEELRKLKGFALDQLTIGGGDYTFPVDMPDRSDYAPSLWLEQEFKQLDREIKYHSEQRESEIRRTEENNKYLRVLWEALPEE